MAAGVASAQPRGRERRPYNRRAMTDQKPYYITTPIYYVNDRPHIGHCYTTIVADALARFQRAAGRDVFFLTGTDEHGQKVEKSAAARGMSPKALADANAEHFRQALAFVGSSHDHFIRTTDADHERQVQAALRRLIASGDVYLGTFEGWYDEGQEEYVTENQAREKDYKGFNGLALVKATEQNYYFRLKKYEEPLKRLFAERPDFVRPEARRNEVLGRLNSEEGLQDVPVSRTSFTWGIPVPGDAPGHVTYVWIDALFNYATALGMFEEPGGAGGARAKYWPAQVHAIGKEILWFHAVIWPALLMALKLPLPECVYAHSFWIREGRKMSKTLGNFVDLATIEAYCAAFGVDAYRWFMLTQGPLGATDSDFSHAKFVEVYNADLANGIGNAFSRVSNMIEKYFGGVVPEAGASMGELRTKFDEAAVSSVLPAVDRFDLGGGLSAAMLLARQVDVHVNDTSPFKLAKDPANMPRVGGILYDCAEALRIAAVLLTPAMPGKMGELLTRLGQEAPDARGRYARPLGELCKWGALRPGTRIVKGDALFPRADPAAPAPTPAPKTE
ncbi:MAG TPA: methionine--tRNA ligase [Phycisphaerales bacterium]|nr:methionine--tRNA ligase [Phycisphaerales bacterium]